MARKVKSGLAVTIVAVLLVLTGGAPSEEPRLPPLDADVYWSWAKKRDTAQAYRCFLYHYPDDPRAAGAKHRWAELDFLAAQEEGSLAAYRRFLRRHAHSRFAEDAAAKIKPAKAKAHRLGPSSWLRERALDALLTGLKDWGAHQAAAEALGQIGDPRAVDALLVALKDSNRYDRSDAAWALGQIALKHGDLARLRAALNDPATRVRQAAAQALALVSQKRYELLLGASKKPVDQKAPDETGPSGARRREGDILAQIRAAGSRVGRGDAEALAKLREGLKSSSIDVQIAAIRELVQAGQRNQELMPEVRAELERAMRESPNRTVTLAITGERAKTKDAEALKDIEKYLKSPDPVERMYAADVLGEAGTGNEGVAEELVAALDDADPLVRVHAASAILRILKAQQSVSSPRAN